MRDRNYSKRLPQDCNADENATTNDDDIGMTLYCSEISRSGGKEIARSQQAGGGFKW